MAEQIKATGYSYWACRACSNYAAGMNHRLKEVQEQAQEAINLAKANTQQTKELKEVVEKQGKKLEKRMEQTERENESQRGKKEECNPTWAAGARWNRWLVKDGGQKKAQQNFHGARC
jgi:hypothetical protein